MYSKVPVVQQANIPKQQNTVKYTIVPNQSSFYGKVGVSANLGSNPISLLDVPIIGTLQPLANLLTIIQSNTFWLNALGIVAGLVLIFIAVQFILQYETTNIAKGVVKTAVGKG